MTEPEYYTPEEMEAVENHISAYFGSFSTVYHELISPDLHVDVCVIPPDAHRDYITLVTMGMGAHRMAVPEELSGERLNRAELLVCLPPDWKIGEEDERWYWPVRMLKSMARLPGECETWLGWGHTVENQEPYAENTALNGGILISPQNTGEGADSCTLPGGETVRFYQVIPLYPEEMAYKQTHDAQALLERMAEISFVVDPGRSNVCEGEDPEERILDDMQWHLEDLRKKSLPVEEITACNHLAIYLRWCMERELTDETFASRFPEQTEMVRKGRIKADLREWVRDDLGGKLCRSYFNDTGRAFADWYYGEDDSHYYPSDIDGYTLQYFGETWYHSETFKDEAYLFVPYDEAYYQGMKACMDRRWEQFQSSRSGPEKNYRIKKEDLRPLLHGWTQAEGCLATDRILVDGCRVGYFYREEPDGDWPDSGWRFTAGDESDAYMDDPAHSGIYTLNTVCNYDPEILPFLDSPYGSAFYRDENGEFQPESLESTGSESLLSSEDIQALRSFEDGVSGYYYKMLDYLNSFISSGVAEDRFTLDQAREDLEIALWYAYACNNIDDYEHYYMAAKWMPYSEKNARGCGVWYYRCSCAMMYCSRLNEALQYAEKGLCEEPEYPWGWLQAAKLRSHFGKKEEALEAVARGLELVPGDYEFQTLREEILAGRTLEEMEYHYIDPASDQELQAGVLSDGKEKQAAIDGIRCDPEGLERVKAVFHPVRWEIDAPYCGFVQDIGGKKVEYVFRMNEAALSKMDPELLRRQKEKLEEDETFLYKWEGGCFYQLQSVLFNRDYSAELVYGDASGESTVRIRVRRSAADESEEGECVTDAGLPAPEEGTAELAEKMSRYLGCPCRYFAPMEDDDPLMEEYRQAVKRGKKEGFLPVLVAVDETLWESLLLNSGGEDAEEWTAEQAEAYRGRMCALPLEPGRGVLDRMTQERRNEAAEDGRVWDREIVGEESGGEVRNRFSGYWDYSTRRTIPLLLAEIPVRNPWEIFAWLPFGGWNDCPDTPELMAVSRYWFERYGAVPAVLTHDELEFRLPSPAGREQALELAEEQYGWCPDLVDQGPEGATIGTLADTLSQSTVWYFWWD